MIQDPSNDFEGREIPPVTPEFFDGSRFWVKNDAGEWVDLDKQTYANHLATAGGLGTRSDPKNDQVISEVDARILDISKNHRVKYAGLLSGWAAGYYPDEKLLVTETPRIIDPAPGEWPLIDEILTGMFVDEYPAGQVNDQTEWLFPWLQNALYCHHNHIVDKGLALVLVGEKNSGKSLLIDILRLMFGGSMSLCFPYLCGEDQFNADLFPNLLQVVDDESYDSKPEKRRALGQKIKRFVAVNGVRCRAMHQGGITLRPLWRLVFATNAEAENLNVLPPLSDDIRDKFLILIVNKKPMPRPASTTEQRAAFLQEIEKELPHFIHYILNEHQVDEEKLGRFGSAAWVHPYVDDIMFQTTSDYNHWCIIQKWLKKKDLGETGELHAQELLDLLTDDEDTAAPLTKRERDSLPRANHFGGFLKRMCLGYAKAPYIDGRGLNSNNRRYNVKREP